MREARSLHAGSEDSAWAPLEQGSRARTQAGPSIHDGGLHCATGPFTCRIFNPEKNIKRKAPLSFFVGEEAEVRSEVSCLRAHRRQLAEYRCKSKDRVCSTHLLYAASLRSLLKRDITFCPLLPPCLHVQKWHSNLGCRGPLVCRDFLD